MLLLHSEVAAESFFTFSPFSYVALKPYFGTKFKILKNMKTTVKRGDLDPWGDLDQT